MSPEIRHDEEQLVANDGTVEQQASVVLGEADRAAAAGDFEGATELLHEAKAAQDLTDF